MRLREKRTDYAVHAFEHQFAGVLVLQNTQLHDKMAQCLLHRILWSPEVDPLLQAGFRNVPDIDASTLRQRMQSGEVVLVDCREPYEQAVSMIKGAISRAEFDAAADRHGDSTIVVYCTVGYRSGRAAASLEKRLGRPVYNLSGGIIKWFNQGGQVIDSSGRLSDTVHPFNADWSRFIGRKPDH